MENPLSSSSPSPAGLLTVEFGNTTPAGSAPPIGSGPAGASGPAGREAAVAAATRAAIADFHGGTLPPMPGKRGNGQRGPDKRKRAHRWDKKPKAPLAGSAPVAADAAGLSVDGLFPSNDPFSLEYQPDPAPPILDDKTLEFLAEGLTGLLEDIGVGLVRRVALSETKDAALAKEASKCGEMSERTRKLIVHGAVECAKKYGMDTEYGPEACLIGGIGFYSIGIALAVRELKSKPAQSQKPNIPPAL